MGNKKEKWVQVILQITCPDCEEVIARQIQTKVDDAPVSPLLLEKVLQHSVEPLTHAVKRRAAEHVCKEKPE